MKNTYSPDILNCLANLSSDEVFTSPELANRMLDLLPQELFGSPKTRFLDPCSKSGVFLREITKRLLVGLEKQIPDLQQRIDHIMSKQVFGIACTDITAEMSRRTLYCTKQANGEYSVTTAFHDVQGNLKYERCRHTWNAQGRCEHCGASQGEYLRAETRETYAYPFIHKSIKEIFKKDMQFDVIIGNPPYQMSTGGSVESQAIPLYNKFVLCAKKLNPRFLVMIIPSRWMNGGFGLDSFREEMLNDRHIRVLHDYMESEECFPGVALAGGVCYFLRDKDNPGICKVYTHMNGNMTFSERNLLEKDMDTFIRFNEAISIVNKVKSLNERSFSEIVSPRDPFGLNYMENGHENMFKLFCPKETEGSCKIYSFNWQKTGIQYAETKYITTNKDALTKYKIFISKANGAASNKAPYSVLSKPIVAEPNTFCNMTYLLVGPFNSKKEADSACSYINTKFFRFLVSILKNTQNALRKVYAIVPIQQFSHPWTDEMLYKKYNLDKDEIAFVESMIRPME